MPAAELADRAFDVRDGAEVLEACVQPAFECREVPVSFGQDAVMHEQFAEELDPLGLGECVERLVGQWDVSGCEASQESVRGCGALPGVDTLGTLRLDKNVDESFEAQVRGSVRFQ